MQSVEDVVVEEGKREDDMQSELEEGPCDILTQLCICSPQHLKAHLKAVTKTYTSTIFDNTFSG